MSEIVVSTDPIQRRGLHGTTDSAGDSPARVESPEPTTTAFFDASPSQPPEPSIEVLDSSKSVLSDDSDLSSLLSSISSRATTPGDEDDSGRPVLTSSSAQGLTSPTAMSPPRASVSTHVEPPSQHGHVFSPPMPPSEVPDPQVKTLSSLSPLIQAGLSGSSSAQVGTSSGSSSPEPIFTPTVTETQSTRPTSVETEPQLKSSSPLPQTTPIRTQAPAPPPQLPSSLTELSEPLPDPAPTPLTSTTLLAAALDEPRAEVATARPAPPPSSSSLSSVSPSVIASFEAAPSRPPSRVSVQKQASTSLPKASPKSKEAARPNVRPKSSIPTDLASAEYARQCIEAAENSRLSPLILHPGEYEILRDHLSHAQVTTYLNLRNGILRLWYQNPRVAVTRDEAVGCASARWVSVASVCYDWLVRNGYINYGCLQLPTPEPRKSEPRSRVQRTVVVIGAGMAGLGCARQLEGLFKQYAGHLDDLDELPPKVIVVEGRSRIGGRVYSRPLRSKPSESSSVKVERHTAEMGGMIITGFIGNPLNILVRGQLGLSYHVLNSRTTIYDYDGQPVADDKDQRVEKLYNHCLDRVSDSKFKVKLPKVIQGNKELILEGRDASYDGTRTIRQVEDETHPSLSVVPLGQQQTHQVEAKPTASQALETMGWDLRPGLAAHDDLDLLAPTSAPDATLGSVIDSCISQYKKFVDLMDLDFRLLNWHIANLEYSNATNMHNLSLGGWDIDAGNEWGGKHTMIVGGYQRVARGLLHYPSTLNLRTNSPVKTIKYHGNQPSGPAAVICEDGSVIEADMVVSTIPLGVLKHEDVQFSPPLPEWKTGAIDRLGFGVLNKVVLVYKRPFWDVTRNFFGTLRRPDDPESLDQSDYRSQRGRFFQFVDVSATTGLPCLVALMAGDAAVYTEDASNVDLISEATEVLQKVFGPDVPLPIEGVVVRWLKDRFARGSYSSSGADMRPTDYDTLAKPIGNLYFAGEHTTGTHPATVHGAYLSGLRAAGEVLHALIGDIEVPTPLIMPKESQTLKRKAPEPPRDREAIYEEDVFAYIVGKIGPRPECPPKVTVTAYRLYCTAKQEVARQMYQSGTRPGKRKGKAGPNEVRHMLAQMWKEAGAEERKPFDDAVAEAKAGYSVKLAEYTKLAPEWDEKALAARTEYEAAHPFEGRTVEQRVTKQRRAKRISYAEVDDD